MDPNATVDNLRDAIEGGQYADAVDALRAYYEWRLKGGAGSAFLDGTVSALASRLATKLEDV